MKSKIITVLAALIISNAMMAQFHFGIKGGANVIKVAGKSFNDEFRYGYHLGGFAEIGMGGKLKLQPEILYNQFSMATDSSFHTIYKDALNQAFKGNIKLNYLTVPILLNYKLVGNFISLQAGPQFGILVNQSNTVLQNGANAFKNGDFSMVGGAQVKVGPIRVNGRYVIGLKNINDIDNQDRWKSQGFQLSVGLAL
jgi:hypothetical protein